MNAAPLRTVAGTALRSLLAIGLVAAVAVVVVGELAQRTDLFQRSSAPAVAAPAAPAPPTAADTHGFRLDGAAPGSTVSGIVELHALAVPDGAHGVGLFADGDWVAGSPGTPFTLTWDTNHEGAGDHELVAKFTGVDGKVHYTRPLHLVVVRTPS